MSTTLNELAKGDQFTLGSSEIFTKVAEHHNLHSMFSNSGFMIECKDEQNKRYYCSSDQIVKKLVKPLTLGELEPGESFRFKDLGDGGKVYTKLDGIFGYGYKTHTYVMDKKYVVYNYQTGMEVERIPYIPF